MPANMKRDFNSASKG